MGYTYFMYIIPHCADPKLDRARHVYEEYFQQSVSQELLDQDDALERLDQAIRNREPLEETKPKPLWISDKVPLKRINISCIPPASHLPLRYREYIRWRYMQGLDEDWRKDWCLKR